MSALTEALERIRNHHLEHNPELVEALQPGLTREEIHELIKDLPFPFPEELYELYQWRNGMEDDYDYPFIHTYGGFYALIPLEDAVKRLQNFYKFGNRNKYGKFEHNWLIIFTAASDHNAAGLVIVLGEETAAIRCYDPEDGYYGIIHPSLTNLMLSNASSSDFSGADLRKADFTDISLCRAVFKNANLESADMRYASFYRVVFEGANLESADMREASLNDTDLSKTNLNGAKLKDALYSINTKFPDGMDLSELIFVGAGANLRGVYLQRVYLRDTNLKGADLSGAWLNQYLNNINLENANLTDANLEAAQLNGANLINANLTNANLKRAKLDDANLKGANLTNANLEGATLDDANLKGANLTNVNLYQTYFKRTNFTNANFLGGKLSLYSIEKYNPIFCNTIMPDGSIRNPQDLEI